jgi:hypothetical protein
VRELSDGDEYMAKALLALRGLATAQTAALGAFDALIENADPGFDPDPVAEFDERTIVMDHLGAIRGHVESLVRMLAAQKGKYALAELVGQFEAVAAERGHVGANEPFVCERCGITLGRPQQGGTYVLGGEGPHCVDEVACGTRAGRR